MPPIRTGIPAAAKLTLEAVESMSEGSANVGDLLRGPSLSKTDFDSFQFLAVHLRAAFHARLYFVSCRRAGPGQLAVFPYDTVQSAFAEQRSQLYRQTVPLDIALARSCRPFLWSPGNVASSDVLPQNSGPATTIGDDGTEILLVPFQSSECIVTAAVLLDESTLGNRGQIDLICYHCMQFLAEHYRHHPLSPKVRPSLLSPQEERVILACADGLTDKEIGREMEISPHTVRAHLNNAKEKLGARNKTHATVLYLALLSQA